MGSLFLLCLLLFSFNSMNANGKLIVSLTFDDGYYSHMNASMVLNSLGMLGTFYVNSGRFNINRMGKGALLDVQSRNHEIAGHTVDHANLLTLTTEQQRYQICGDYQSLVADGFAITNFAYPFGADFPGAPFMLYNCGYQSARDSGGIKIVDSCLKCLPALLLPVPDNQLYRLSSIVITSNMTLSELLSYLNAAAYFTQYDERWLIFTFHDIVVGTPSDLTSVKQMTYDNFLTLLDAINGLVKANIVEVLPVRDVMTRYRSAYVPLPTDTASPPSTTNQPLSPTTAPAAGSIIMPSLMAILLLMIMFF